MNRKLLFSFSPLQMVSSFLPFLFQHQCHLLRVSIFPWPSNLKQVVLPLCSLHKTWKTQNSFTSFPLELRELPLPEPQPSTVYSKNYANTKSKDRILTFKEATTECELVTKAVTKEVGRCQDPKTQRGGLITMSSG